jgi:uncharacterized membrane protein
MRSFVSLAILFLSFALFSSVLIAQTSSEKPAQGKVTAETSQSERKAPSSLSEEDETVLREDIVRMRAILDQMVNNLAFVDTTQSPLKHQFQLEIDMWNTAINDMERRLRPHTR